MTLGTPTARLAVACVGAALLAGVLLLANGALARRDAESTPVSAVLRELVPQRVVADDIVRIELVDGAGRRVEFRRDPDDGLWRCMSAHGALAEPARLSQLLTRTLGGGGMVRTADPAEATRYGLDGPATTRMILSRRVPTLAEPDGEPDAPESPDAELEVVLEMDIGLSLRDADQCFVRVAGSDEILAMEADIRQELRPDGPGGLPLIETHLVPTGWPGIDYVPRQIIVLRRGELPLELRREDQVDDVGEVSGWRWFMRAGDGAFEPAHDALPMMYVAFLTRARIIGILGAETAESVGFNAPVGRVILGSEFSDPMELRVAPSQEWGTPVYGSFARTISVVDNEVASLMLPRPDQFHPLMVENPWAAFTDRPTGPTGPRGARDAVPGAIAPSGGSPDDGSPAGDG